MRVRELAAFLGATFEGDGEREIRGGAPLESAGAGELSFAAGQKAAEKACLSAAACLIVPHEFPNPSGRTVIRTAEPRTAFAAAISRLYPAPKVQGAIHPTAVIAPSAKVHPDCHIGPHVSIGENTEIGARTRVGPGSVIGNNVEIGEACILHGNVTVYDNVSIGSRVVLHSGSVLGADGFGFVLAGDHYEKFPQIGRVVIEDDVEIGANACVDRAALGVTLIGQGTKLDNMVHIGHNCRIGRHVVIAAQTGLSGGVSIGDYAIVGGQVGVGDKARIEARAVIGSKGGILPSKIVRAGEPQWGIPARPLREHLEQLANISRLPQLREEMRELRRRLEELEQK